MALFAGLAVIFAGFAGGHGAKTVSRQVEAVVRQANVQKAHVPARTLHALAQGGHNAKQLARSLHAEGVVVCTLVKAKGTQSLRVLIYDANGTIRTDSETALTHGALTADDLDVLRENLTDDVAALTHAAPAAIVADASPHVTPPSGEIAEPWGATAPTSVAPPTTVEAAPVSLETSATTDVPTEAPAAPATTSADSVSADEIEAMTAVDTPDLSATAEAPSVRDEPRLQLGAAGGVGVTGRTFSPGPMTLPGYTTSAVGSLHVDAHIAPTRSTRLAVVVERTLGMTTQMGAEAAPTSIGRWEATASRTVIDGRLQVAPTVGAGRRSFTIDSEDQTRTPDSGYNYLILGAGARIPLGSRIALRTSVAFEPVISGTEPTEAAFGEARRWAFDVGAAVEVRAAGPLVVRAAADYQRFSWSWEGAGARGAGGAVDAYPSASLAVGAEY